MFYSFYQKHELLVKFILLINTQFELNFFEIIEFLGFFNNYAAGLTYYYFLANMFTFTQQFFMKRFINEDAILAEIEANKKKPARPKSKFQKKLEAMQKQQEQKMRKRK